MLSEGEHNQDYSVVVMLFRLYKIAKSQSKCSDES